MSHLTPLAKKLRNVPTEAEKKLWNHLRSEQLGVKFRRQAVIENHIVDFITYDRRLIIELDGGQHSDNAQDIERTRIIEAKGFKIIRYWNNEIMENIDGVLEDIQNHLALDTPT